MPPSVIVVFAIAAALSAVSLAHLWIAHRHDRVVRRLVFTPVVFIPLLGPMLYLGCYGGSPTRHREATTDAMIGDNPRGHELD